ncbi:MAG: hypothetical protein ABL982_12665 [Vicinamibacterales bacterium]
MSRHEHDPHRPVHTEDINPAPGLGRVGDGATLPSGEYISRELREMMERERAHHKEDDAQETDDEQRKDPRR